MALGGAWVEDGVGVAASDRCRPSMSSQIRRHVERRCNPYTHGGLMIALYSLPPLLLKNSSLFLSNALPLLSFRHFT